MPHSKTKQDTSKMASCETGQLVWKHGTRSKISIGRKNVHVRVIDSGKENHKTVVDTDSGAVLVAVNCWIENPDVIEQVVRQHVKWRRRLGEAGIDNYKLVVNSKDGELSVHLVGRSENGKIRIPDKTGEQAETTFAWNAGRETVSTATASLLEKAVRHVNGEKTVGKHTLLHLRDTYNNM